MPIEDNVRNQIVDLINRAQNLKIGDSEYNQVTTPDQKQKCSAWIASAYNIVQIICPDPQNAYRKRASAIEDRQSGWAINEDVGEFSAILLELLRDVDNGLLASIADRARAETFDNFLDHAKEYIHDGLKNESGVIAGVVFEDSIRRVYRKSGGDDKGQKLDQLISELAKSNVISQTKAKRARVAAHVRTKATHAQWDEFDAKDVQVTIDFAEELILNYLDL